MFKIGDKVILKEIIVNNTHFSILMPQLNKIYKIRNFQIDDVGEMYIRLEEIINEIFPNTEWECAFALSRFEKVDELFATEVLENILTKIKEKELEII